MSKGKHKRKRQRAQQHAEQQVAQVRVLDGEVISAKEQPEAPKTPDGKECHKERTPVGFREFLKRPSITDWCIAGFTFVLASAAIYQFIIMGSQLKVMRIDQRAWLKFEAAPVKAGDESVSWQIVPGQPVTYPLRVVNTGKTPATNIDMRIFADIVDASQEPPLGHVEEHAHVPHGHITAGIIFPSSDFKQPVVRPGNNGAPLMATDDEVIAVRDGRAYLAVYGVIAYDDVFKTRHWTKFCNWIALKGQFHALKCTQYNSVDSNQ